MTPPAINVTLNYSSPLFAKWEHFCYSYKEHLKELFLSQER